MEDDEKNKRTDEDKTTSEEVKAINDKSVRAALPSDDAGPSGTITLPGAVHHAKCPLQAKPGISKSEHSIRHIITSKDVTNALKSLSFAAPAQAIKNLNLKELKIPILDNEDTAEKDDSTTLIDLKKFMASCFKVNREAPTAIVLGEISNVQNVRTVISPVSEPQEIANSSCNHVQTESAPINLPNEVIVTSGVEPKLSKSDKKKTSGSLSERSDLGIAQRDSLSSIGSNVCRICMTRGRERLISPCNCKGSLANVHLTCLERWLNQVGRNHCELCGFSYPAIRTPRYTVLQALRLWFGNPRNRSHLQSDCLIFWLLSTVTAGLLAVCIVGTQYFVIEGSNFGKLDAGAIKEEGASALTSLQGISHRITETAMDFFMAIVLCGYSVTVYLLWKDHYVMWNRWRRANVNVRLLLTPDANPVPFVPRARYNVV
ncbi:uncharacterized protein LOC113499466 isoform X2 [Trichoplusia ni]|uniref:Uncharacterized protein LOC113499466 isoform X2 n=1 Tax=Trichoplusia ni TaxID=7111 RepID=A0A7E5W508_TRINI|nr:uncharacterized protein LOC113499466 isoform X2 [Trichoplusia ni]